ncbi:hypothetical protein D3C75_1110500 [compost metagenome]
MATADQMRGPHRRVAQGDICDPHLLAAFEHQHSRAVGFRLAIALSIRLWGKPGAGVTVDAACTAEGKVMRIAGVQ